MSKPRCKRRMRYRNAKSQLPTNDRIKVRIVPDLRGFQRAIKRVQESLPPNHPL